MRAGRLIGRGDFAAAGPIVRDLVAADPNDSFAKLMLALCYEHEGRLPEALRLAEETANQPPEGLALNQIVIRLALASDDHEKATEWVERTLKLPDVRTEMPERLMPRWLQWLLLGILRLPVLRRRVRPGGLAEIDPGHRAVELQTWKQWALEYLAWRQGQPGGPPEIAVH